MLLAANMDIFNIFHHVQIQRP